MTPTRSILITGCSSGIGQHAAGALKKRGWRVFAAARKDADVARLAAEGFDSLRLDYTDAASIAAALDAVLAKTGGTLDALFNNGGFAQPGALEDLSTDLLRAQFEVNFFGWHELTLRVIPVMRRQGAGRIVFCSSVLGYISVKYRGAYAASKYAVEAMADTLRLELFGSGIRVVLIEPGPIETSFVDNALAGIDRLINIPGSVHHAAYQDQLARHVASEASSFRRGPEAVLMQLVQALESPNPRPRYRVTLPAALAWHLKRILPVRVADWFLRRVD